MKEKKAPAEKAEKKPAAKKLSKPPREFRRPVKSKRFDKRYIKYLEHPDDRKFFTGLFSKQDDVYTISEELKKDDAARLKKILGVIKQNRKGPVGLIPLAFAAIVTGAIIVFVTVFANPLLERAMEKGLEAIFEARADVDNFRLNIFRFSIRISGITVANRDKPMTNLFEMGRTVISLNSAAVLRGKVYINEVSAASIRFGTPRTFSGALPGWHKKEKPEKEKSETPPLVDLKNFDAMALLNQEYDKLSTPKLYDDAINAYNATLSKYKGQADAVKTRSNELKTQAQPLLNLNVNSMRDSKGLPDVQAITKTIQDITAMVNTVQTTADDAAKMVKGLEDDIKLAQGLEQKARGAITSDLNHLKSYIDLGSGAAYSVLEPVIRDILTDTGEQYLDYGLRALEIMEQLKSSAMVQSAIAAATAPKEEKPKKTVFKGRDVEFPVKAYPKFYLGKISSDFTIDAWNWAFDMRNISSDPDLTYKLDNSKPAVTLELGMTEEKGSQRRIKFDGMADFRDKPEQRFKAEVDGAGFPFELGDQMKKIGINGFNGMTEFSVNLSGQTDGGASGGGNVKISQPRIVRPEGTIAEAVDTAVREAGLVSLGMQYTHNANQKDEFKITTNLADLIAKALKAAASAYAKKAMDEIEKVLRQKIDQYIGDRFASKDDVDALFRLARGDKAAVDQLKNSLNAKKTEFENQAKAAGQQALNEAKTQGTQAAQDVLQGKTPTIQLPSTGIKLPGR